MGLNLAHSLSLGAYRVDVMGVYDLSFQTPKSGHRDLQLHRESSIIGPY